MIPPITLFAETSITLAPFVPESGSRSDAHRPPASSPVVAPVAVDRGRSRFRNGRTCGRRTAAAVCRRSGIRNYLQFGGHGVLVFDIDAGHRFVRRIPSAGFDAAGRPINVKGVCASVSLKRLYVTTIVSMLAFDLETDALVWEKQYDGGCDRMAISPDGRTIYLPSFEKDHWHAVDAASGEVLARIEPQPGAHNTVFGPDGREAYLAGLRSTTLAVVEPSSHKIIRRVGPFGAAIRPFTVNGSQTRGYMCVNDLLGFEVGDLQSGKLLSRVEVAGFKKGPVARHGCPSHGIGITPDEKEIWLCDAHNRRMHVFDATVDPPRQLASLSCREEPGWITFGIDGRFAYPSTGEVFEVAPRKLVARLSDETGREVHSEKMLEIDFAGTKPVRAGVSSESARWESDRRRIEKTTPLMGGFPAMWREQAPQRSPPVHAPPVTAPPGYRPSSNTLHVASRCDESRSHGFAAVGSFTRYGASVTYTQRA